MKRSSQVPLLVLPKVRPCRPSSATASPLSPSSILRTRVASNTANCARGRGLIEQGTGFWRMKRSKVLILLTGCNAQSRVLSTMGC